MFQGFAYAYAYLVALLLAVALVAALLGFFVGRASGAHQERRLRDKLAESLLSPTPLDSEQYYLEAGDASGMSDAAWATAWESDWGSVTQSPQESEVRSESVTVDAESDTAQKSWSTPDIEYHQPGPEPSPATEEQDGVPAWLTEPVDVELDVSDADPVGEASVPSSPILESSVPDTNSVVPAPQTDTGGARIDSPNIWPAMASSDSVDSGAEAAPDSASPASPSHEWDVPTAEGSAGDVDVPLSTDSAENHEPGTDFETTEVRENTESDTADESASSLGFGAGAATAAAVSEVASQDSETDESEPAQESEATEEKAQAFTQEVAQDVGLESDSEAGSEPSVGRARTYTVSSEGSVEVSDEQSKDGDNDPGGASKSSDDHDVDEISKADAVAELERLRTEMYRLETGAVSAWDRVVPQLEERIGELERDNNRLANELRAIEGQMMLKAGHRNRPGSSG